MGYGQSRTWSGYVFRGAPGCGTAKVSSLGPQRPCAPQAFADPSASVTPVNGSLGHWVTPVAGKTVSYASTRLATRKTSSNVVMPRSTFCTPSSYITRIPCEQAALRMSCVAAP